MPHCRNCIGLFLTILLVISACGESAKDSVHIARQANPLNVRRPPYLPNEQAARFAVTAYEIGLSIVECSQLASRRSGTEVIQDYADELVADHLPQNKQLEMLAATLRISIPPKIGARSMRDYSDMKRLRGKAFDVAYLALMIENYRRLQQVSEQAIDRINDTGMLGYISRTLPVIRAHLTEGTRLQAKMDG